MKYQIDKNGLRLSKFCSLFFWKQFRYPQPIKGRYDATASLLEKMKWAYKCWYRQIEVAEQGSGIEGYFAAQDLTFSPPAEFVPEQEISISAAGDLMAVDVITPASTTHLFDGIKDFYFDADIVCANLESTVCATAQIGRKHIKGMPAKMNISEEMFERFWQGGRGINYFSTANNHCYDYGEEGFFATMEVLESNKCRFSGTNRSPEEQEDVLIIEKNGLRVAMLAYTFDMNGNHYDKKHLINEVRFNDETVDIALIERHIAKAREKKADLIVASCHWGWEFEMYPHKSIMEVAHRLADAGVDVILGGHPHVCQPMERYMAQRGQQQKQCLIIYSLGDFVSYHPLSKNSKLSMVLRLKAQKGSLNGERQSFISSLEILPVYILAEEKPDGSDEFRLLKFTEVYENPQNYQLPTEERQDLPRLNDKVLHSILLPS